MIHAQQRGFTPEEILNGLCDAVARNFRSSITKGRSIVPDVGLVGGVATNAGVVRALERAFGWEPGSLIVPADPASFGAIGAACLAHERAECRLAPRPRRGSSPRSPADAPSFPTRPAPVDGQRVLLLRDRLTAVPPQATDVPVDAFLGIDIGSVSTNLVVIDAAGQVLKEIYLRTDARPVEAVGKGLREIERDLGDRIRIRGVGTTGSGRELIAELVGADTMKDEITAHKTGAAFIDQGLLGLGVDTIFEIGGQDAKFISLEDGIVVDFTMNEACAAGTGSFLEERAQELGIRIEGEFAALALSSRSPDPARRALHRVHGAGRQRLPAARGGPRGHRRRARLLGRHQLHQPRRARAGRSARPSSSRAARPTTTRSPRRSARSSASGSSCRPSTA